MPAVAIWIAVEFVTLVVLAVVFALAYLAEVVVLWFADAIEQALPGLWFGLDKHVGHAIRKIALPVAHFFGKIAAKADYRIGQLWHGMAVVAAETGQAIADTAQATWRLGEWMHTVVRPWVIHGTLGRLTHQAHVSDAQWAAAQKAIDHGRNVLDHPGQGALGAYIATQIRPLQLEIEALQRELGAYGIALPLPNAKVLPGEVPNLRARAREAEGVFSRLWAKVRGLDRVVAWPLSAALVVSAVGRLGGGWIFCRNWGRLGRGVCRLPGHLLDDLLGLLTDFAVLVNICQVLPWLETAFEAVAAPMVEALAKAGAALHCGGGLGDETLAVPALHLPGSSDVTLHLP